MALILNAEPNNPSYGSTVVNGLLVPNFTWRALGPSQAAAPYWYGNGSKPATLAGYSAAVSPLSMASGVTGMGGGAVATASAGAGDNPWSLVHSPTPWAMAFLVIGFLGLRFIHWRPD